MSSSFGSWGPIVGCAGTILEAVGCDGPTMEELAHISRIITIMSAIISLRQPIRCSIAGFGGGGGGGSGGRDGDVYA
ncbi:UNVERIFIED_CONTAM: hypothetical protein Slati_3717400 [Sesamum latifolium]|uniref:Uncharacterized protein n=1 Tax=Sesamum latifolium TaxID=2727402 RepID=A0AAW2U3S8_9LAMI